MPVYINCWQIATIFVGAVKGTVIRQEFHSRNGGDPEGTVSMTAYSTAPEDLEKLLQSQGEKPSRLHGLAAITTTKKFGGDTGSTFSEVATVSCLFL